MRGRCLRIVADGFWRARAANTPRIRAEVEAEFSERVNAAAFAERIKLKAEMRREIARRLEKAAPRAALY